MIRLLLGAVCLTGALLPGARASAQEGCAARVSQEWAADGPSLTLSGFSDGPTCADAVATLVIRAADGAPLWAGTFVATDNFLLRDASSPEAMAAALGEVIDTAVFSASTTATLPEWPDGADRPAAGEFPFYPSELYAYRDNYVALRDAGAPYLCIVAGIESALCVAFYEDRIDEVGIQSFPG